MALSTLTSGDFEVKGDNFQIISGPATHELCRLLFSLNGSVILKGGERTVTS